LSSSIDRDDGEPKFAFGKGALRPPPAPLAQRSAAIALEFQRSNEALWNELEQAVQLSVRELDAARFFLLYRRCCEHLALARARDFPAPLIERLVRVTARAHRIVYRQTGLGFARISRVLLHEFPARVRAERRYVALAALLLLIPAVALGVAVYRRPDLVLTLVDGRTAAQFESMYNPSSEAIGRLSEAGGNGRMFGYHTLFNIRVALECYLAGALFGLGSALCLAFNGAFAGAIAGYIVSCGLAGTFFPFIAAHAAFEFTAVLLCGAAGLRLGRAMLFPGRTRRVAALQRAARETSVIVFGSSVMLVIAAAIETFFSAAAWITPTVKFTCAGACWGLVAAFFMRRAYAD
jgi:uncharacterized membrane protein SpoIIM required for sporulation